MASHDEQIGAGDWYDILGVPPGASDAEIGRAFRQLARRYHPDVIDERSEQSDQRFEEIARAYEVLRHPDRRADYDRARSDVSRRSASSTRIPIRRRTTRDARSGNPRSSGAPVTVARDDLELTLSFREAVLGATKQLRMPRAVPCSECGGSGRTEPMPCSHCGGLGRLERASGSIAIHHVCAHCGGLGSRPAGMCPACRGSGCLLAHFTVTIRIPPGTREGTRLRVRARGTDESDATFVLIRVEPEERFTREGADVVVRVPLNLAEAALGATVPVADVNGDAIELRVPPGTQSGTRLKVPAGLPLGHLVAVMDLVVPTELSPGERAALEAFERATPSPRSDGD